MVNKKTYEIKLPITQPRQKKNLNVKLTYAYVNKNKTKKNTI